MCGIAGEVVKVNRNVDIGLRGRGLGQAIQHRGHETGGETVTDGQNVRTKKGHGVIVEAVSAYWADKRKGKSVIVQVRYSTTGSGSNKTDQCRHADIHPSMEYEDIIEIDPGLKNSQPFFFDSYRQGRCALVHNGNLTNALEIKIFLREKGGIKQFDGDSDSELILKLICYFVDREGMDIINAIRAAMTKMRGAWSCIFLTREGLWAFRDKKGFWPLHIAETDDSFIFASEECAWHTRQAKSLRSVEPGEIVEAKIGSSKLISYKPPRKSRLALCTLNYAYLEAFYNPETSIVRPEYGFELYKLFPCHGLTVPIMNSGEGAAVGYHNADLIEEKGYNLFFPALYKNPKVGRTFLEPQQIDRIFKNKIKYFFLFPSTKRLIEYLATKKGPIYIILVDDSLIRGTVARTIIKLVRQQLREIYPHLYKRMKIVWLSSFPQYKYPCYFGMDTYNREKLIAANRSLDQIRRSIRASFLGYLPEENFLEITARVLGVQTTDLCRGCTSGDYPIPINPKQDKFSCADPRR